MSDPFKTQVGGGHYKDLPIQPVEFCQRNKLGFCESSAIAYLCRHGRKNGRQDLEKAIHFIQLLMEMEYPEMTVPATPPKDICAWLLNANSWITACGQIVDQVPAGGICPKCNRKITTN